MKAVARNAPKVLSKARETAPCDASEAETKEGDGTAASPDTEREIRNKEADKALRDLQDFIRNLHGEPHLSETHEEKLRSLAQTFVEEVNVARACAGIAGAGNVDKSDVGKSKKARKGSKANGGNSDEDATE